LFANYSYCKKKIYQSYNIQLVKAGGEYLVKVHSEWCRSVTFNHMCRSRYQLYLKWVKMSVNITYRLTRLDGKFHMTIHQEGMYTFHLHYHWQIGTDFLLNCHHSKQYQQSDPFYIHLIFWLHFSFQCKTYIHLNKMSLKNYTRPTNQTVH
jgi:hypothetical protein